MTIRRRSESQSPTPRSSARLLRAWLALLALLVPLHRRDEWVEEWRGEAWYAYEAVPDAPRRRALRLATAALGDAWMIHHRCGPARGISNRPGDSAMQAFFADLRYGLRALHRAPGFATTIVLTLTLGIGSATALFSVVDAVLLRPLPYDDPDRLVMLWQSEPASGVEQDWFSPAQYVDLVDGTKSFSELALALGGRAAFLGSDRAEEVRLVRISSSYLAMLGAVPILGRPLAEADDAGDAPPVVLLTHAFWLRRFGGDPGIVGSTVEIGGTDLEVVGVLAHDLLLDQDVLPTVGADGRPDVVLSLPMTAERLTDRGSEIYNVIGQLAPDADLAVAQEEVDAVAAAMRRSHPELYAKDRAIRVLPLRDEVVGGVQRPLFLLGGAVILLLLVACSNVANLLLARGTARRREMGIRGAVGAARRRLVRQLLTESLVPAALGGLLGLGAAHAALRGLRRLGEAADLPRLGEIGLDLRVLAFALVVTSTTVVVFGLLPAFRAAAVDPRDALNEGRGGGATSAWGRFDLASGLVVAQVALSLILLVGGGLLARSFVALLDVDPGFDPQEVVTLKIGLSGQRFADAAARDEYFRRLLGEVRALPGVEAAGTASILPFGPGVGWGPIAVEGHVPPEGEPIVTDFRLAGPGYFEALRIPLRRGRAFTDADDGRQPLVAVIDEAFVRYFWPGEDPLGRRVEAWDGGWATIVGVVAPVKQTALDDEPRMVVYFPHGQVPAGVRYLAVRAAFDAGALADRLAALARDLEPQVVVTDIASMTQRIAGSVKRRQFAMLLLQVFAAITLTLATVGLYGVVAYRVGRSARGFSLRAALGATPGALARLVLRHGLAMAAVGVSLGLFGAFALSWLLDGLLYGIAPTDPATYAAVAAVLAAVTLLACWIPARRAARVEPLAGLRE